MAFDIPDKPSRMATKVSGVKWSKALSAYAPPNSLGIDAKAESINN